jgi:hypothetical protein
MEKLALEKRKMVKLRSLLTSTHPVPKLMWVKEDDNKKPDV